jgi:hypothetical protein
MSKEKNKPIAFIRELCKHKTEEEILEAEANFRQYLAVVKEICEFNFNSDTTKNGGIDESPS